MILLPTLNNPSARFSVSRLHRSDYEELMFLNGLNLNSLV